MLDFYIFINSTTTDAMYRREGGNTKKDEIISWEKFNENIKALLMSPSDFYIIGVGFIHIRNGFGHQSTGDLLRNKYNIDIPTNRTSLEMECGVIFVPQYRGPRLAEGATELPQGAKLTPKINFVNCEFTNHRENFIPFSFAEKSGYLNIYEFINWLHEYYYEIYY